MYSSLIPRILYGNLSAQEALQACEEEFFQEEEVLESEEDGEEEVVEGAITSPLPASELSVQDVMEEVTRLLEERKES
jgi:hypothetical protein